MIDRGALVLSRGAGRYRGVYRPALDARRFTGRRGKDLVRRYRQAIVAGEGVIEDLDEAIALVREAAKLGVTDLEVVVFEVPQEPPPARGALPIVPTPPAEGLVLLGYDVIELMEPFWSPLAQEQPLPGLNAAGLFATRADAEAFAQAYNASPEHEEDLSPVRVWALAN